MASQLRTDPNPRVISALLENGRLTEKTLIPLAAQSTAPRILDLVARNPRWGWRSEVRKALAKNGATPFRAVLKILPTLARADLIEITNDELQSVVIRNQAANLLEKHDTPAHPRRRGPIEAIDQEAIDRFDGPEIDSDRLR